MKSWLKLIFSITAPVAIGLLSGLSSRKSINTWYRTVRKPSWNPPNAVFGPVWTTLYILMGISLYLVWQSETEPQKKQVAVSFWAGQLMLNALWSYIFFNRRRMGLALVDIVALWLAIVITIFRFARINKTAAWLLVPYISWVSFATILNYNIRQLNA